jgi:uncharacterized membrane protein
MQGKATIGKHPIHPMLVALPIGFFAGVVVSYIIFGVTGNPFWPTMAVMLMIFGIVGALLAALFGFIDYFTAPMSPALKKTATNHMILNLGVVVIFLVALWQGWTDHANPVAIGLSVLGVLVLGVSGWLGGKLSYEGHVGSVPSEPGATSSGTTSATRARETTRV